MQRHSLLALAVLGALASHGAKADEGCGLPFQVVARVQSQLATVVTSGNGGLFTPNMMWSAVVDRKGRLCSVISIGDAWPGSRDIAIAKAHTANGFSNDKLALSTANLYAAVQPGASLFGLNNSNPFNPEFNAQGTGIGQVPGGVITFGGGVALYFNGRVIGGLGVSGDTSCADHAIAFRMRAAAGFDVTPTGKGADNIVYSTATAPGHPHCTDHDVTP